MIFRHSKDEPLLFSFKVANQKEKTRAKSRDAAWLIGSMSGICKM